MQTSGLLYLQKQEPVRGLFYPFQTLICGKKDSVITSLSGVGISTHAGLVSNFLNIFLFSQMLVQDLCINLEQEQEEKTLVHMQPHHFGYLEANLTFGCLFYIKPVNGCDKCPQW